MKTTLLIQSNPSSDIKYKFRQTFGTLRNVREIKLKQMCIPNSNQNIEYNSTDKFYIYDSGNILRKITLEAGSYNINDIMDTLQTQLNALFIGNFTCSYNINTYKVKIECANLFKIATGKHSINAMLGFSLTSDDFSTTYVSNNSVKINSNKLITLNLQNVPQPMVVPNLNSTASFLIPIYSDQGNINFLSETDLSNQSITFQQDGIDLSHLDVSLMRTDYPGYFNIDSDWSFLIEVFCNT